MINEVTNRLNIELQGEVLISGGAGFLGSWLSETLASLGLEVVCVDDLSTGLIDNVSRLADGNRFKFVREKIENYRPEGAFKYIIHLASRPSPDDYVAHPIETLMTSAQGTLNTLEAARKNDAVYFLASTSEIYGDAKVIPTPEQYWGFVNPVGIRSCYDEGKRFAEALTMAYRRQYALDCRIMRIFNVYGPRMRSDGSYGRVIPIFITQALDNVPLTIHGDGSQTRSFTYVSDWLEAALLMLSMDRAKGQIINVGDSRETSILELAQLIVKLTNSRSPLTFLPPRVDDPKRRRPDVIVAKDVLGWLPRTPIERGLERTIEWLRGKRSTSSE